MIFARRPTPKKGAFMHVFRSDRRSVAALWLVALFLAGCGATTVTPTFPVISGLPRPDRVLVYDFAVTPDELEIKYGLDTQASGGTGSQAQTEEDIRLGKAFARALTDSLVGELRSRGIDAYRANDAAPPGENTASIKGRFLRTSQRDGTTLAGFGLGGGEVRTQVQIYQGTGLNLRLVAEAETATPSNLKPGIGITTVGNEAVLATVQADAKRTATAVVERITDYYKRQGWG